MIFKILQKAENTQTIELVLTAFCSGWDSKEKTTNKKY